MSLAACGRLLATGVAAALVINLVSACDDTTGTRSSADTAGRRTLEITQRSHLRALAVDVTATVRSNDDGLLTIVQAVGADGEFVTSVSAVTADGSLRPFQLRLVQPGAAPITIVRRGAKTQVSTATVDARHVVWTESPGTAIEVERWTMYDYDRTTGRVRELARAPLLEGGKLPPPVPGFTSPVLIGEEVFWAQVGGQRGAETADVYGCRIDACTPRVVVPGAAFPTTDGRVLVAAQTPDFGAQAERDEVRVVQMSPGDDRPTRLFTLDLGGAELTGVAATASDLALIVSTGDHDTLRVMSHEGRSVATVSGDEMNRFGFPVGLSSMILVAETSGSSPLDVGGFAYDLKTATLSTVGNAGGLYNLRGRGDHLAFQRAAGGGKVDTVVGRVTP